MELTFHDAPLQYLQELAWDTVYQEETAEVIVPDSMPDMGRIVDCCGTVMIRSKEWNGNTAVISGAVQAAALYIPEGGGELSRVEAYLPFTLRREIGEQEAGGSLLCDCWLRSLDARMLNSRKVLVRANPGFRILALCPKEQMLAQPDNLPEQIQLRQNTYTMLLPVCCGEKSFPINDELTLPESAPGVDKILKSTFSVAIEESKMVGAKAVFKGEICLHLLYQSADGTLHTYNGQMPFSQYAEMERESENGEAWVLTAINDAEVDTDGQIDSHRLLLTMTLLAQICVIDPVQVTLAEDAYALSGNFEPQWQKCALRARLDQQRLHANGEWTVGVEASQVLDTQVLLDRPAVRRDGESLWAVAGANVSLLYYDPDGQLQGKSLRAEVSCNTKLAESGLCRADAQPAQAPAADVRGGEAVVQMPVDFCLSSYAAKEWQNLSGGEYTPDTQRQRRPSVVVCRAKDESLWNLAKRNRTTVAAIQAANALRGDAAQEGEILLIPLK